MKLIVGLGNPGKRYANSRHNIGVVVAEVFAVEMGLSWRKSRDLMCYLVKTRRFVLVRPTIYMNESGESVRAMAAYYKIDPDDVLVIHDELDLPFGKIRLSFGGAAAGHRGIESVMRGLATGDFARLRVGIGKPEGDIDAEKYVLTDFGSEERVKLPEVVAKCQEAIMSYLDDGLEATMNRFN